MWTPTVFSCIFCGCIIIILNSKFWLPHVRLCVGILSGVERRGWDFRGALLSAVGLFWGGAITIRNLEGGWHYYPQPKIGGVALLSVDVLQKTFYTATSMDCTVEMVIILFRRRRMAPLFLNDHTKYIIFFFYSGIIKTNKHQRKYMMFYLYRCISLK